MRLNPYLLVVTSLLIQTASFANTQSYEMCYQTNIRIIKDEIMKANPANAELVVKNFCACVTPYVDSGFQTSFKILFSCRKDKKLNLTNPDPVADKECQAKSTQAMNAIINKMSVDCKPYQDALNKISDTKKVS